MKRLLLASAAAAMIPALLLSQTPRRQAKPVVREVVYKAGENGCDTYRIPAVVVTKSGVLLAFAEARWHSSSDTGDIDLVVKRSTDGGRTWSESITVWDDGGNVCGNPSPVVDRETGRVILLSTWNRGDDTESAIHGRTSHDTRRVFMQTSDDEGLTWSPAREITAQVKDPEWTWYATGPCHAIQLQGGRIVVPCNHGVYGMGKGAHENMTGGHLIYSDDLGQTWHIGGDAGKGNEATCVELDNGDVLLNMRGARPKDRSVFGYARMKAISSDKGETLGEVSYDRGLVEPVCNASINNYSTDGVSGKCLIFSNPSDSTRRRNMCVHFSTDNGRSWRKAYTLTEGPAAYSDLLTMPDGNVAVLYETGEDLPYENITFTVVPQKAFVSSIHSHPINSLRGNEPGRCRE